MEWPQWNHLPVSAQRVALIYAMALLLMVFTFHSLKTLTAIQDVKESSSKIMETSNIISGVTGPSLAVATAESETTTKTTTPTHTPRINLDNVAVVIHTGKQVIEKRMPVQMNTFLKDFKNLLLVADYDGEFMGHHVHNVLDGLYEKTKARLGNSEGGNVSKTSRGDEGKGWDGDAHKFIPGFKLAYEKFPDVDWYILIDDDVYLYSKVMEPIMKQLKKMDPSQNHYLGRAFTISKGACGETNPPPFGHGGTGIYVSKGAMQQFLKVADKCIMKYANCWAGDVRMSLCFRDAGIKLGQKGNLDALHNDPPVRDFSYDMNPCSEPSAFHHLTPTEIQTFHNMSLEGPVTMAQVYHKFKGVNVADTFQTEIDITGHFYHHSQKQTYVECQKQCVNDPKCAAWVAEDNKKCWLKQAPGGTKARKGWIGGQIGQRYQCIKSAAKQ
ncbi:hypothetical protein BDR26DRAFT_923355 [Obelidium mucronatum]|nr:hypothetical protein BDR26DRAFT_923355 [Obelidium mucronatum]